MAFNKMLAPLLRGPVGNGFRNDEDDVKNLKTNFKTINRYEPDVENGYIDRELNDSIIQYQKDKNLKVDGFARPGGETEATLVGEILGVREEKPQETKLAAAPAVPAFMGAVGRVLGRAAPLAWDMWQNMSADEREDTVDKAECDAQYQEDTEQCNDIAKQKGVRAGAICHSSASERYAACLAGKPETDWPPLQR